MEKATFGAGCFWGEKNGGSCYVSYTKVAGQ